MTGDNKVLSDRQVFRTSVLENVSLAMMLAPYVAVKWAGDFRMLALFVGIVFSVLYGLYIHFVSDRVNGSYEEMLFNKRGILGKIIGVIYYFRFYVRAALYIVFLGEIVSNYMLINMNRWIIIGSFF